MPKLSRRELLKAATLLPAMGAVAATAPIRFVPRTMPSAGGNPPDYASPPQGFLSPQEKAFVDAAVARIIPADELGPGAREAGVADFIDRQLAGPYGAAETWYMQGPWQAGTEQQGYQLKLSPAQLYRATIREIDEHLAKSPAAKPFAQLDARSQDDFLHALEKGEVKISGDLGKQFFEILVVNTVEGFLADPIYGGNRDFIGWKLIGFPGPRYNYVAEIGEYGRKYDMPFVGIAGRDSPAKEA
jgi:gluconate 2-dehydrogenase gamma chain